MPRIFAADRIIYSGWVYLAFTSSLYELIILFSWWLPLAMAVDTLRHRVLTDDNHA